PVQHLPRPGAAARGLTVALTLVTGPRVSHTSARRRAAGAADRLATRLAHTMMTDNMGLAIRGDSRAMSDHDGYINKAPEALQPLLEQVRSQLSTALPDAVEIMKFNMPGFAVGEATIAGYAAFSRQCGLYLSPGAITALAGDL